MQKKALPLLDDDPFTRDTGSFVAARSDSKVHKISPRLPTRPVIAPERGLTAALVERRQKDLTELLGEARDSCNALFEPEGKVREDLWQLIQYWVCRGYDIGADIKRER